MPLLNPAALWDPGGKPIVLWHGCTANDASKIASGISLKAGRWAVDFGRGFYTTTLEHQARQWAWTRYYDLLARRVAAAISSPVTVRFVIDRHELSKLRSIAFVGESYTNEDFWSLVQHCRQSIDPSAATAGVLRHHHGPVPFEGGNWYDLVTGPVAAFWQQRSSMSGADQISFHTPNAVSVLNACIASGSPDFTVLPVV